MAGPEQRFHHTTYMVTRRCTDRKYLIRPSEEVNEILLFCMIHAANKFGVKIHIFAFISNHFHILLTDPHKKLSKFMHWLDQFTAKCLNFLYGRCENLWNNDHYSAVTLRELSEEDKLDGSDKIVEKIIYILTNPVQAGLVNRGYKWPGVWSPPALISSGYIEAKRPKYFSKKGIVPEKVRMKLCPPPGFSHMSPREFSDMIAKKLKEKEDEIQKEFKAQGRKFMGAKRVKAQSPESRPKTKKPRRQINPRIACEDKSERIKLLLARKQFQAEHKEALEWFCAGKRDVVFPSGTYKMQEFFNVNCQQRSLSGLVPT